MFDGILLFLLIFGFIIGFLRGFKHSLNKLILLGALLIAIYIGIPIGMAIMKTELGQITLTNAYASSLPNTDTFLANVDGVEVVERNNLIMAGYTELKFPKFFAGFFLSKVMVTTSTVKVAIASSFAYYTIVGISFLLFFILAIVLLNVIFKLILQIFQMGEDGKSPLGRFAGGLVGIVKASAIFYGIMFIIVMINQIMMKNGGYSLNNYLVQDLNLNDASSFSLARLFYNYTLPLLNWISAR